jgi:hypothetical protein
VISVILPAARLQEQAQQVVDRLWQNNYVSEVVVASPNFSVERAICVKDERVGSARVLGLAYKYTRKENPIVCWLSDICYPESGALDKMLGFLVTHSNPFIAEFRTHPPVTEGHYRVCTIKGRQYARWGMLSRKTIEAIGGFFDEAYVSHYGDVDLSLRCWRAGGSVSTCTDAVIEMHGHWHVNTAPQSADEALFFERWRYDYPAIVTEHTSQWNVDQEIPL